jgi:hypothetical protein
MKNFKLAVLVAVVLSLLYSCMTDSKALQTVLTKKPLFDTVGKVYTQLHPCDPVSIVHHSDTSYLHDTSIVTCHDTIGNYIHDTTTITHTNTKTIHDKDTIVDNQQIKILESEISFDNVKLGELTGQIIATQGQVVTEHHRGNDWALRFWLLLLGVVIAIVLMILKPKI